MLALYGAPDPTDETLFELLSLPGGAACGQGIPPRWLREVEERLQARPDSSLSMVAEHAKVHPVYLSRAFRRWYGTSPSVFRLRQRTSAAIDAALWSGKAASTVAHEVGFADQSHMVRSIRSATGHSLSELRVLAAQSLNARRD
jgi:AraC family transcriptional regulator